jgi:hypothetical protein
MCNLTPELSGIWAAPSMLQDQEHAGCGPNVRLNDWLGRCAAEMEPH